MTNIDVKNINEFHEAIATVKATFPHCWYRGLTDLIYPLSLNNTYVKDEIYLKK